MPVPTLKDLKDAGYEHLQSLGIEVSYNRVHKLVKSWVKANPNRTVADFIAVIEKHPDVVGKPLHYKDPTGNVAVGNYKGRSW